MWLMLCTCSPGCSWLSGLQVHIDGSFWASHQPTPQVFLLRSALNLFSVQSWSGLPWPRFRTLHIALLNFMRLAWPTSQACPCASGWHPSPTACWPHSLVPSAHLIPLFVLWTKIPTLTCEGRYLSLVSMQTLSWLSVTFHGYVSLFPDGSNFIRLLICAIMMMSFLPTQSWAKACYYLCRPCHSDLCFRNPEIIATCL